MNPQDDPFETLLKAASQARKPPADPLPFAVEARVLAHWRNPETEDEFALVVRLFRRAMYFALLIVVLSGAWNYLQNKSGAGTQALASYAMKLQLPP
jgi:hypothetical protein